MHAVFKSVKRSHKHRSQKRDKVRVVLDLRRVNEQVESNLRHIPDVSALLDSMMSPYSDGQISQYFSSIDVSNMFYQIGLYEDSRDITSFMWRDKQHRFCHIAQDFKVSPAYSSLIMGQILGDLKGEPVFHYIDDLIITSATLQEHVRLLDAVLSRFAKFFSSLQ